MIDSNMYSLLVCCYRKGFKVNKAHEWLNAKGKAVSLDFVKENLPKVINNELSKK